jgi:hypothetical protein
MPLAVNAVNVVNVIETAVMKSLYIETPYVEIRAP